MKVYSTSLLQRRVFLLIITVCFLLPMWMVITSPPPSTQTSPPVTNEFNQQTKQNEIMKDARDIISKTKQNNPAEPLMKITAPYSVELHKQKQALPPASKQLKKVISFGLYGARPKYTTGALRNVELQKELFPDWVCRFYIDDTVPQEIIDKILEQGGEVINEKSISGGIAGMFRRFLVADDPTVDVYIIRDTDSRLSAREKAAIDEWLAGDKNFHVMRDHPSHSLYAMSGGMWGGRKRLDGLTEQIKSYRDRDNYIADMNFLGDLVWPRIKDDVLQHDSFSCKRYRGKGFPTKRIGTEHVGQVFDERDMGRKGDMDILARALPEPPECSPP